jgi:MFS family permease
VRLFQWSRDFGIFLCTQGVSNVGDAARNVLIPLYVLELTHNPLQVTAVAILQVVTSAGLRIPLGAVADRREGRQLMIIADVARTLLTAAIPLTSVAGGPALAVIYIVIIPISGFSALFESAVGVAVPAFVPEDKRGMAYAWRESLESMAWVMGPPLGGLLAAAIGTGQALGLDSASFLVSVAGLVAVRKRFEPEPSSRDEKMWASVKSGLRVMRANPVLRRDQIVWGLYTLLGGSIVLGLVYIGSSGGKSGALLATIAVAAYAAGSVAGTLIAGTLKEVSNVWLVVAGGLGCGAAGAALVALGWVPVVISGAALFGLGEGLVLVFHLTLRSRATPDGYFGRVTGVAGVISPIASGLSIVWLGLVYKVATGRTAFVVLAAALLILAVCVAVAPKPVASPQSAAARPGSLGGVDPSSGSTLARAEMEME